MQALTYDLLQRLYDQIDYSQVAEEDVYDLNFEPVGAGIEASLWYTTEQGFEVVRARISEPDYEQIRLDFNLERIKTFGEVVMGLIICRYRWHDTLVVDEQGDSLPEMQRIRLIYTRLRKLKLLIATA